VIKREDETAFGSKSADFIAKVSKKKAWRIRKVVVLSHLD